MDHPHCTTRIRICTTISCHRRNLLLNRAPRPTDQVQVFRQIGAPFTSHYRMAQARNHTNSELPRRKTMKLFKSALNRRRGVHPAPKPVYQAPAKYTFSVSIEEDLSELDIMSGRNSATSLADSGVGSGSHYLRRPTLSEILADEAPPPWTLEAFTCYSAKNLCLENLEFIQDVERYKKEYNRALQRAPASSNHGEKPLEARFSKNQKERLREMWTTLMIEYIAPSSPRELNLPSDIRSGLVSQHEASPIPSPEYLKPAVSKILELIQDSTLFSFLNDVQSPSATSVYTDSDTEVDHRERSVITSQPRDIPRSSFEHSAISFSTSRRSPKNSHFHLSHMGRPSSHVSTRTAHSSSGGTNSGSASIAPTLTDDSGSLHSPSGTHDSLSTPPKTPPRSEFEPTRRSSPKQRNDAAWKRMSQRFGFRKRSVSQLKDVEEDEFSIADL